MIKFRYWIHSEELVAKNHFHEVGNLVFRFAKLIGAAMTMKCNLGYAKAVVVVDSGLKQAECGAKVAPPLTPHKRCWSPYTTLLRIVYILPFPCFAFGNDLLHVNTSILQRCTEDSLIG